MIQLKSQFRLKIIICGTDFENKSSNFGFIIPMGTWLHFGWYWNQDFSMTTEYFLLRFFLKINYDISLRNPHVSSTFWRVLKMTSLYLGIPFTNPSKIRFGSFLSFPTSYPSATVTRTIVNIISWECCLVARIKKQIEQLLSTSCSVLLIRWGRENPLRFVFSFGNSVR